MLPVRAFPSLGISVREAQNGQKSTGAPANRYAQVGHGPGKRGIYGRSGLVSA